MYHRITASPYPAATVSNGVSHVLRGRSGVHCRGDAESFAGDDNRRHAILGHPGNLFCLQLLSHQPRIIQEIFRVQINVLDTARKGKQQYTKGHIISPFYNIYDGRIRSPLHYLHGVCTAFTSDRYFCPITPVHLIIVSAPIPYPREILVMRSQHCATEKISRTNKNMRTNG